MKNFQTIFLFIAIFISADLIAGESTLMLRDGTKIVFTGELVEQNGPWRAQTLDGKYQFINQNKIKWVMTDEHLWYRMPTTKGGGGFELSNIQIVSKDYFVTTTIIQLSRTYVFSYDGQLLEKDMRYHWVKVADKNNQEQNAIILKYFPKCPALKEKMESNMKAGDTPLFNCLYFNCGEVPTKEEFIKHLDSLYDKK